MDKDRNIRICILAALVVLVFAGLLYRLWMLQIVNGKMYAQQSQEKMVKVIREPGFRGNIYDRKGRPLAYNRLVDTVIMTDSGDYENERERQLALNSTIYRLLQVFARNGEQVNTDLEIVTEEGGGYAYSVSGTALERFKADIFGMADPKDMTEEQKNMTAEGMVQFLSGNSRYGLYGSGTDAYTGEELRAYGLPEHYTQEETLQILGIRRMLAEHAYRKYVPVVLAKDVSEETKAHILENADILPGVSVSQDWERVYSGGEALSHILGYVGGISEEELEEYRGSDKDYTSSSVVGKAGMEQYLEERLQGTDGEKEIYVNNMGEILEEGAVVREAVNGEDVYLTIDMELQKTVYEILEQRVAQILADHLMDGKIFDKGQIADTTDIRIPVYDVYIALFENGVIRTDHLYDSDATELERQTARIWEEEQQIVLGKLEKELLEGNTPYQELSEELQEVFSHIVNQYGYLDLDAMEEAGEKQWEDAGELSLREYLMYAAEQGWLKPGETKTGQVYYTVEEIYGAAAEQILERAQTDGTLHSLLFRYLILEDRIMGRDVCRLLYDQGLLDRGDEDYENLAAGKIHPFAFVKKKILSGEISPAWLALDPCSASAVVVEQETNQVLACVSYPGYDNSRLANQLDGDYYNRLLNDQSLPLYNRATQQLTAPGSTLKPLTVIAGLQEGVITADSAVFCDGVFDKVTPSLKCWNHSGHGNVVDAPTALQFSCNDYLCEISYRLGTASQEAYDDQAALDCLRTYAELFRLNEKSGIEIHESEPHVTDAYGIPSAIGQGTHNFTTVQLARYVNAIASRGNIASLTLLKEGDKGEARERIDLPDAVWDTVQAGMRQFAGANAVLKDMEPKAAGKTGTAQESRYRPDHALFAGYAPAVNPQITAVVRIANGYSSSNATMAAKGIFDYYFGMEE